MNTITTFIVGIVIGFSVGSTLATNAGDFLQNYNAEQKEMFDTRNAIQFYEYQHRPSTAIPYDPPAIGNYGSLFSRPCY